MPSPTPVVAGIPTVAYVVYVGTEYSLPRTDSEEEELRITEVR